MRSRAGSAPRPLQLPGRGADDPWVAAAPRPRAPWWRRLGHLAGLGLFVLLLILWLGVGATRPGLLNRDWVAFDNAGWRALSGDWRSIYTASSGERWQYLYPLIAVVLSLPLGLLPYFPSYVFSVLLVLGGTWWSFRLLRPLGDGEPGRHEVFCTTALCVPTTLQVLITGQYSWLYLLSLSGLAAHWSAGDERRAGRHLALLALKPNIGIVLLPLLLLRRRWETMRAATLALTVAVAATAPFGLFAWPDFVRAARGVAARQEQGDAPIEKQTTILSFLHVLSGRTEVHPLVWLAWLVVVVVIGALVLWAWRAAGPETSNLRLVGMAALAIVALSPRLYFYDGMIAILPAAHWYLARRAYASRAVRRLEGGCIAGVVVVTFLFFSHPAAMTVFGPLAGLWLVLESIDVLLAPRRAAAAVPGDPDAELVLAS